MALPVDMVFTVLSYAENDRVVWQARESSRGLVHFLLLQGCSSRQLLQVVSQARPGSVQEKNAKGFLLSKPF